MSLLKFLRIPTRNNCAASVARERLQIVLSHERAEGSDADFLPKMRNELLAVISKYVKIDPSMINVQLQKSNNCSVLELNIPLPTFQGTGISNSVLE